MKKNNLRIIAILAVLTLALALIPVALAAGGFQAVVTSGSMKVYQQSSPYRYVGSLPKGTTVTVQAYSGKAALIDYNGRTGIARVSDMKAVTESAVRPTATPAPTAAATGAEIASAKEVVTNRATRVYSKASTSSSYISVPAGTKLGLLAVSGSVAKVARGGLVGYTPAGHLSDPAAAQPTAAPTVAPTEKPAEVETYDRVNVVTTAATRVYAKPSTSSAYISVAKGTPMLLLAAKGNCAMVERDGKTGYVAKSLLTAEIAATQAPTPTPTPAPTAGNGGSQSDGSTFTGTNEEITFKFLTKVAGYNAAAACGIMANIKYESGFKATSGGDKGTSYGIVQWHAGRKTRLINWCGSNGYDYTTLKGQLYFLQYELKRYYPAVHNKLNAVSNTEQGAYDAGYAFCYSYEAPANRAAQSVKRGNYAKTTLWTRYKT